MTPLRGAGEDEVEVHAIAKAGVKKSEEPAPPLLALQAQQLADLTAAVAAQGRAQTLQSAQQAAAQDQAKEQLRRFLTPGSGYQPTSITMFH